MNKEFWRATGIRCLRTFLTTILGVWTGGQLITEVDWKFTLISAISATVYIFITCILAGLPEVEAASVLESHLDIDDDYDENDDEDDWSVKEEEPEEGEE